MHLKERLSSYKDINHRFGFFSCLQSTSSEEVRQICKEIAEIYYEEVFGERIRNGMSTFNRILVQTENEETNSI